MTNQQLYESIMMSIEPVIYREINEAYDNMLLEKYDFKDFIDSAINVSKKTIGAVKDAQLDKKTVYAYRFVKKYIALSIDKISETKGGQAVRQYMDKLKEGFKEDLLKHNMTPQQMIKRMKITTAFILGASVAGGIYVETQRQIENPIQNIETVQQSNDDEMISQYDDLDKFDAEGELNYVPIRPTEYYQETKNKMYPTQKCINYIKKKEALSLIPYYANDEELAKGIITIGYGHVIFRYEDGERIWLFPKDGSISKERQEEIKNAIINTQRHGYIERSSCEVKNGINQNTKRNSHMKDIITMEEAEIFFKNDIKFADRCVRQTLGFLPCGTKYDTTEKIDTNVRAYCYYNQNVYDLLLSATFNMGAIRNNTRFSIGLQNCRFDEDSNSIDKGDFATAFAEFKNLGKMENGKLNPRRIEEYNTFNIGNTDKVNVNFNYLVKS